jgi:hypothetical protein
MTDRTSSMIHRSLALMPGYQSFSARSSKMLLFQFGAILNRGKCHGIKPLTSTKSGFSKQFNRGGNMNLRQRPQQKPVASIHDHFESTAV